MANKTPAGQKSEAEFFVLVMGLGFIVLLLGYNIYPGPQWRSESLARQKAAEAARIREESKTKAEELRQEQLRIKEAQQEAARKAAAEAKTIREKQLHEQELRSIALELLAMSRDPDKFSDFSGTCLKADNLMSRTELLRDQVGVVDFNFWSYQSDLRGENDPTINEALSNKAFIRDGKIDAFELLQSIDDYRKTCNAVR